jgi:hypothetical protein
MHTCPKVDPPPHVGGRLKDAAASGAPLISKIE